MVVKNENNTMKATWHSPSLLVVIAATLLPCPAPAQDAANYPLKPVRIIVALAPGGATDVQARLFAAKLSQMFGPRFVVDNRPGAGSIPGFTLVAKAPPDGYTLLAAGLTFTLAPALQRDLPIDPIKDFAPVSLMTKAPWLLVVHPSLPAKSVKELVALAKARPGVLNFGGGTLGAGTHLLAAWFIQAANIKAEYVPYSRGTALSTLDLVAGRVDASIATVLTVQPFMKTGRLRALGITSAQRSKVLPDIPTIAEQGVPGYDAYTFHGWAAPAGTPPAIVSKLGVELAKIAKSPEIEEKLKDDGGEPVGGSPEQFKQFIAAEVPRWRKLVQDIGLKLD